MALFDRTISFAAISLLLAVTAAAQVEPFSHTVKVLVSGDDELRTELRRAVRSIDGVAVSDVEAASIVNVVVIPMTIDGRETGVVAAVTLTTGPSDPDQLFTWLTLVSGRQYSDEERRIVSFLLKDRVEMIRMGAFSSAKRDRLARQIAAFVDEECIEPARQAQERAARAPRRP